MKRLIWPIIGVMLLSQAVMAQPRLGNYSQRGNASQEMQAPGFAAAHPSLPLNSKVTVKNPRNNKEVEVTVVARIEPSAGRIVDLSFAAMEVLGMKEGGAVILTVGSPSPNERAPGYDDTIVDLFQPVLPPFEQARETPAVDKPAGDKISEDNINTEDNIRTEINKTDDNPESKNTSQHQQHQGIIVNTYVNGIDENAAPASSGSRTDNEFLAWLMTAALDARQAREAREGSEIREAREAREYREGREIREAREREERLFFYDYEYPREAAYSENPPQAVYSQQAPLILEPYPAAADAVQIVPGLPDRNSGKIYRLQVGAYSAAAAADKAAETVKSAGFNVEREYTGSVYRVLAAGIASADVYSAAVRLGSFGFGQIWVRE